MVKMYFLILLIIQVAVAVTGNVKTKVTLSVQATGCKQKNDESFIKVDGVDTVNVYDKGIHVVVVDYRTGDVVKEERLPKKKDVKEFFKDDKYQSITDGFIIVMATNHYCEFELKDLPKEVRDLLYNTRVKKDMAFYAIFCKGGSCYDDKLPVKNVSDKHSSIQGTVEVRLKPVTTTTTATATTTTTTTTAITATTLVPNTMQPPIQTTSTPTTTKLSSSQQPVTTTKATPTTPTKATTKSSKSTNEAITAVVIKPTDTNGSSTTKLAIKAKVVEKKKGGAIVIAIVVLALLLVIALTIILYLKRQKVLNWLKANRINLRKSSSGKGFHDEELSHDQQSSNGEDNYAFINENVYACVTEDQKPIGREYLPPVDSVRNHKGSKPSIQNGPNQSHSDKSFEGKKPVVSFSNVTYLKSSLKQNSDTEYTDLELTNLRGKNPIGNGTQDQYMPLQSLSRIPANVSSSEPEQEVYYKMLEPNEHSKNHDVNQSTDAPSSSKISCDIYTSLENTVMQDDEYQALN